MGKDEVRGGSGGWATHNASEHRDEYDLFPTNVEATRCLLRHVKLEGRIWEPASGLGHISRELEAHGFDVWSTDLRAEHYGYGEPLDFLESLCALAPTLVTNPPYKLLREFLRHALTLPGLRRSFWHLPYPAIPKVGIAQLFSEFGHPEVFLAMVPPFEIEMGPERGVQKSFFQHVWLGWDHEHRADYSRFVLADWRVKDSATQASLFTTDDSRLDLQAGEGRSLDSRGASVLP